jgi:HD-like signal output (HDOD) protein
MTSLTPPPPLDAGDSTDAGIDDSGALERDENQPNAEEVAATAARLHLALDSITVARPAAVQVLTTVDDPNADAHKVAAAVERDPGFAAQLMRLANSAYYGMSGRVGNTSFAVTVIGFSAIRSMAALSATGLDTGNEPGPARFWEHAAATAAACSTLAPRFGLVTGDAFAAGLLHDLGIALLSTFDRDSHQRLATLDGADGALLAAAERMAFGMGHDDAAAHVLSAWRFPPAFIDAIAGHHAEGAPTSPLSAATRAGDAVAVAAEFDAPGDTDEQRRQVELLCGQELELQEWSALLDTTRDRTTEIIASLSVR